MLVVYPVLMASSLVTHAFMDGAAAAAIATRWKPQAVGGNLVPTSPIDSYVKARIVFANTDGLSGAILSDNMNLFAIRHSVQHDNCGYISLEACLWRSGTRKVESFRALRDWVAHHLPNHELHCNLRTAHERTYWNASA